MDNEPILKIDENGTKEWWLGDRLHRVDGPAVEDIDGAEQWWLNGELHRADGPAVEYPDGFKWWYLNDRRYKFDDWLEANKFISDEEKVMLKLTYG
jgi:hypothetical protein